MNETDAIRIEEFRQFKKEAGPPEASAFPTIFRD